MLKNVYAKSWKILLFIPVAVLFISLGILGNNYLQTGSFIQPDVELTGGKLISFEVNEGVELSELAAQFPEFSFRLTSGVRQILLVTVPFETNETEVIESVTKVIDVEGTPTTQSIGPTIGKIFFQQAQTALVAAFILMGIVVFIIFRKPVPSAMVLFAAGTDIIGTMGIMSLFGIKMSLPMIAALLALIGYSVDTDILLTTEVLKRKKEEMLQNIKKAAKTGLTMSLTTIVAMIPVYFVTSSFVLQTIALVIIIGLTFDIFTTWLTNVGMLRWWMEKKAAP